MTDSVFAPRYRAMSIGVLMSVTVVAFQSLGVGTVMPAVARDLGGLEHYGWAFSAFMLASLVGSVAAGQQKVSAIFPTASQLFVGSEVRVLGVAVGRVTGLTPLGDTVRQPPASQLCARVRLCQRLERRHARKLLTAAACPPGPRLAFARAHLRSQPPTLPRHVRR